MLKRIKLRIRDMKTISQLISGADEQANKLGDIEPGAEHYVLSALELPDGSAKRVFDRVGIDVSRYKAAIQEQYSAALSSVGISADIIEENLEPVQNPKVFKSSKPSGQAVMKLLYELKKKDKDRPLMGAHVISVVAGIEHGVVARVFSIMGIERSQLTQAVNDELASVEINHQA